MELPESISNITTTVTSDPFNVKSEEQKLDINKIVDTLRYLLPSTEFKYLEEGLSFYKKDTQTYSTFLKSICSLYLEVFKKEITSSNIADDMKPIAVKAIEENITGIQHSIETLTGLLTNLNKQKNILDVNRSSFIMLGYAINIIRKLYNA
jgi:hypothetical protein